ncbi:hypothetical protein H0266_17130 [Halobacillus locisalis]|uniref:Glutaredoxin domain-containing protein n=1 Tax=Halobacillus locisalis TaxID=220753 RepID=A0A838CXG8_9BACI|nr:glutaredoxin domain-containing protein [Halobacillus locisalis]MBA2176614.1 hypothetical protein [Halobacillus locisalis]
MNVLYTIDGCHMCAEARKSLLDRHIPFKEVNLFRTPGAQKQLKERFGEVYVPVVLTSAASIKGKEIFTHSFHSITNK